MAAALLAWAVDVLVVLGVLLMGISVYGMVWLPDVYLRLHAGSKAGYIGAAFLAFALWLTGDPALAGRAFLIFVFLAITSPVAAHVIGREAWLEREEMTTPGRVDESGRLK